MGMLPLDSVKFSFRLFSLAATGTWSLRLSRFARPSYRWFVADVEKVGITVFILYDALDLMMRWLMQDG